MRLSAMIEQERQPGDDQKTHPDDHELQSLHFARTLPGSRAKPRRKGRIMTEAAEERHHVTVAQDDAGTRLDDGAVHPGQGGRDLPGRGSARRAGDTGRASHGSRYRLRRRRRDRHRQAGGPGGAPGAHCGDSLTGVGGVRRPGIVHRLDKDTSGLMVAAKTAAAHAALVEQFASRSVGRRYAALVWGVPAPAAGEISGNIGRSPSNRKKMAVLKRGGRPAVTRYKVREALAGGAASLVECRLLTGRTHQIRVHLSDRGYPVIGDPLYGRSPAKRLAGLPEPARDLVLGLGRQALHAEVLSFDHPSTGERVKFLSQLPEKIRMLKSSLETL
jgi:23S rRNA-/tRNA-specific pseudouridylate synthase